MLGRQAGHTEFLPTFLLCMLDFIERGRNDIKIGQFFSALFFFLIKCCRGLFSRKRVKQSVGANSIATEFCLQILFHSVITRFTENLQL